MPLHPDTKYLDALRNNDARLLEELYRQHSGTILTWVRKNNGTEADARDLFQEALIALHYSAQKADFKLTCPIGGLIFAICRNKWINQLRKKKREDTVRLVEAERYVPESATVSDYERLEEDRLEKQRMAASFSQLSETCQRLLRLLSRGVSPAEAAERLEMNGASTVYRRKNACASRWRELMNEPKVQ